MTVTGTAAHSQAGISGYGEIGDSVIATSMVYVVGTVAAAGAVGESTASIPLSVAATGTPMVGSAGTPTASIPATTTVAGMSAAALIGVATTNISVSIGATSGALSGTVANIPIWGTLSPSQSSAFATLVP